MWSLLFLLELIVPDKSGMVGDYNAECNDEWSSGGKCNIFQENSKVGKLILTSDIKENIKVSEAEGHDVTTERWRFLCSSCVGGYGEAEMQGSGWVLWEWDSKSQLRLDRKVLYFELSGTETVSSVFFSSSLLLQFLETCSLKADVPES